VEATEIMYTASHPAFRENALPTFVESRMNAHLVDRLEKLFGGDHLLHGRAPGSDAIHLSSNDYLCLVGQAELVHAQIRALQHEAPDRLMSAAFLHGENRQGLLEKKFARFLGYEDTLLSQSGWCANAGLIQTLAGPNNPVYLDTLAHASMWEGARAADARAVPFLHNDAGHLERQIQKHGPGIIAVDSVYSTNGSLCPVQDMLEVAERTGSVLVVDESHSLGTHGPNGTGIVAGLKLQKRVHFVTASLAKAFAGRAGIVACSSRFKSYFLMESRPAIFSSCLLRHDLAWFDAALDVIPLIDDRRARLREISHIVRDGLSALGYNVSDGTEQIVSLESGPEVQTLVLRRALQDNGVFGAVFCAPATAKNRSLVRFTLNSGLTDVEIARLIEVCAQIRDRVKFQDWPSTRRLSRRTSSHVSN
jgi:CAI-1 autoinducer synthase